MKAWHKGEKVQDHTTSASDMRRVGGRFVGGGIAAVLAVLLIGVGVLFWALPDANVFNAQVERIFVENDDLTWPRLNGQAFR